MAESAFFYSTVIDPVLKSVRKHVVDCIANGEQVVDVACGTGALVFECSKKAKTVLGVDISETMIEYARKQACKKSIKNAGFMAADATRLENIAENRFDTATLTMALHQFRPQQYSLVLNELMRVASRVIVVDYAYPLPVNFSGLGSRLAEFLAGGEHLKNFKLYQRQGGLFPILFDNNVNIHNEKKIGYNAFHLAVFSKKYS